MGPSTRDERFFQEKDNRTPEQKELVQLRKENQKLRMENDILKQAALIMGRKVDVIRQNRHKYSVSAMCGVLQLSRSTYYFVAKAHEEQGQVHQELARQVV